MAKVCKLCLINCDTSSRQTKSAMDLQQIVKELFHDQVSISLEETRSICKCCTKKLHNFYEYHSLVLENQIKYKNVNVQIKNAKSKKLQSRDARVDVRTDEEKTKIVNFQESYSASEGEEKYVPDSNLLRKSRKLTEIKTKKGRPKTAKRVQFEEDNKLIKKYIKFTCEECTIDPVTCPSYREFYRHMSREHGKTPVIKCCGLEMRQRVQVIKHCWQHENPYNCHVCRQELTSEVLYSQHMLEIHKQRIAVDKDISIYECNECGKRLTTKKSVKLHLQKVHFRTRYHICEHCAVQYRSSTALKYHINLKHLGIKEPRRECDYCKIMIQESRFKDHIKSHIERLNPPEPVLCDICNKVFKNKRNIIRHIKKHHTQTGKKFKCTYCPKSFSETVYLQEHIAVHTQIPLYSCLWCGAGFKSKGNLAAHNRRLHPLEYEEFKQENRMKRIQIQEGN